ncbi:MAG: hypothetical protein MSH25_03345 [Desulfovibrio sp.]|uniref:acyltransferase family protein n=1 Tax=Desulfovibrio sp. TaxID=885 RepID=UPI0025B96F8B|nr:acyltransferase family protein [Desulfovibrio sp.]MCI7568396.1 hypothetical protein [Desulfovibrio sp.]
MNSNRSPGLDVVRTLAISGVLAAHATLFLEPLGWSLPSLLPVHIWGGFLGVELFFALSGFLIGQILFRTVLPAPSWHSSCVFLLRRWMRTLPAYYTVLVVLFFYAALTNTLPDDWLEYIVFTQNAPPEYARFFPVSWSLSIEQWAYIWILIFLLPGAGIGAFLRRRFGWHKGSEFFWGALLICGIVASLFLRIWHASDPSASWDNDFRKQVGLRLDAVLFGVLAAWIKIYAHLFYKMIARNIFLCLLFYFSYYNVLICRSLLNRIIFFLKLWHLHWLMDAVRFCFVSSMTMKKYDNGFLLILCRENSFFMEAVMHILCI